jgi:hypothetical protein
MFWSALHGGKVCRNTNRQPILQKTMLPEIANLPIDYPID